ncbi:hypothetical protein COCON_G00078140 [Conger conger]|uniref:Uncharacterized protein n=1 Tax=Conger conger TaxID=82655 RepID=A0A9Q1DP29_CONCO|nr:hypothetical protein COCON_G00078140 [Conger conger]
MLRLSASSSLAINTFEEHEAFSFPAWSQSRHCIGDPDIHSRGDPDIRSRMSDLRRNFLQLTFLCLRFHCGHL